LVSDYGLGYCRLELVEGSVNPELLASIKQHEGCRLEPYEDSMGLLTVGYGHLLERPITREEAEVFLISDIQTAIKELDRAFPDWKNHSEVRQNVLIELVFNIGAPRLAGFLKFWAALRDRNYKRAAAELLNSKWRQQVGQRAVTLAARMETDSF
jgi:lysozyme